MATLCTLKTHPQNPRRRRSTHGKISPAAKPLTQGRGGNLGLTAIPQRSAATDFRRTCTPECLFRKATRTDVGSAAASETAHLSRPTRTSRAGSGKIGADEPVGSKPFANAAVLAVPPVLHPDRMGTREQPGGESSPSVVRGLSRHGRSHDLAVRRRAWGRHSSRAAATGHNEHRAPDTEP